LKLKLSPLEDADRDLLNQATDAAIKVFDDPEHTVVSALRTPSGMVFLGPNVSNTCAEPVALGAAVLSGESSISAIVAVLGSPGASILPPCGTCRQLLFERSPECWVILPGSPQPGKAKIHDLLPIPYVPSE
jgi:cytidine deaminase